MKKTIIPAIIAKSQAELDAGLAKVKGHARLVQLDVMDGKFVPNHSLDFNLVLRDGLEYEAHLMVENPRRWIEDNLDKVGTILAHIESCEEPEEIIRLVKGRARVGFALNPETPVEEIEPYLDDVDQVLVMTVVPGFYGSAFLPQTLGKVKSLRRMKPELDIEVDGGVTADTIGQVDDAGANMFVSGSYIMKAEDVERAITGLEELIE